MAEERRLRPGDRTYLRRLRFLVYTLMQIQQLGRPVTKNELVQSPIYSGLTQPQRTLNGDLEYWLKGQENPLIGSFDGDDRVFAFPRSRQDTSFLGNLARHPTEKQAIAKHIADHIFHYTGFTFFDVGTTTFHLASHLSTENRVGPSLSVLTNSLFVHPFLAHRGVNIKLIGGTVNRLRSYIVKSNAYDIARERFNDQQLQYSFISIDGISLEKSFNSDPILSDDKHQAILATKDTIIFVADHSKIGNPEGREFTSLDE